MKKYECNICGYTYDPDKGDIEHNIVLGTLFDSFSEDWECPICGAKKNQFTISMK